MGACSPNAQFSSVLVVLSRLDPYIQLGRSAEMLMRPSLLGLLAVALSGKLVFGANRPQQTTLASSINEASTIIAFNAFSLTSDTGDAARHPNVAGRLEVTSTNETLFCGHENDMHETGFAHLTNINGVEDKHMFWWLVEPGYFHLRRSVNMSRMFKARNNPEQAPIVLVFGGGPGSSGMSSPFLGQG
jgi:carboxypeptidase C (cathepsin A)